jgi:AcrR family transcriptional regulator
VGRKNLAETRKPALIEAFLQIVSERGLAYASVREIESVAGCKHGMLRHYFSDKESMIHDAIQHMSNKYMTDLGKELSQHASAWDRMKCLITWWLRMDGDYDIQWACANMEFRTYSKYVPLLSKAARDSIGRERAIITDIVQDGIESGDFREVDPDYAAKLIFSALDGIMGFWYIDPEEMPLASAIDKAIEFVGAYLLEERSND